MYLKLHTFCRAYGFYFYSTTAEVLKGRTSLILPSPSVKRCHTKHAGRYSIAVSMQKLPQSCKAERKRQLVRKQDKREKKQTSGQ